MTSPIGRERNWKKLRKVQLLRQIGDEEKISDLLNKNEDKKISDLLDKAIEYEPYWGAPHLAKAVYLKREADTSTNEDDKRKSRLKAVECLTRAIRLEPGLYGAYTLRSQIVNELKAPLNHPTTP